MADEGSTTLQAALLAFQAEAPKLQKDKINPHFGSKFVGLDTLVEDVMPILNGHGLTWMGKPCFHSEGVHEPVPALRYVLGHPASGEREEDVMPLLLAKKDPQGQGSAITYARRYAMMAVLGLVADEDDDGNAAQPAPKASRSRSSKPSKPAGLSSDTKARLIEARGAFGGGEDEFGLVLAAAGIEPGTRPSAMTEEQGSALADLLEAENAKQAA